MQYLCLLPANFHNFWYIIHYRKFATGRYIVNPPNTVYVTALPCKILLWTLAICLHLFTTINYKKYNKSVL